jgi:hypothetical protein
VTDLEDRLRGIEVRDDDVGEDDVRSHRSR